MTLDLKKLVQYAVWLANQFDMAVTETRLIKYLYLIDYFNAQVNQGKILTGWSWAFVNFGPYCSEAFDALEQSVEAGLVEEHYYDSKYEDKDKYRLFKVVRDSRDGEPSIERDLHIHVRSQLQKIMRLYGDDTTRLLDYVYYDTEPMQDVLPKQGLDFSLVQIHEILPTIKMKKISPDSLKRGAGIMDVLKKRHQGAIADSSKRYKLRAGCGLYDEEYNRALKYLDGEDLETGLKGVAKIEP